MYELLGSLLILSLLRRKWKECIQIMNSLQHFQMTNFRFWQEGWSRLVFWDVTPCQMIKRDTLEKHGASIAGSSNPTGQDYSSTQMLIMTRKKIHHTNFSNFVRYEGKGTYEINLYRIWLVLNFNISPCHKYISLQEFIKLMKIYVRLTIFVKCWFMYIQNPVHVICQFLFWQWW